MAARPAWVKDAELLLEMYRQIPRLKRSLARERAEILASLPQAVNWELPIGAHWGYGSPVEAAVLRLVSPLGPDIDLDETVRKLEATMAAAFRRMRPQERQVVMMRYLYPIRMSREQICRKIGVSKATYHRLLLSGLGKIANL